MTPLDGDGAACAGVGANGSKSVETTPVGSPRTGAGAGAGSGAVAPPLRSPAGPTAGAGLTQGLKQPPAKVAKRLARNMKRLGAWLNEKTFNYESDDEVAIRLSRMERAKKVVSQRRFSVINRGGSRRLSMHRQNSNTSNTSSSSTSSASNIKKAVTNIVVNRSFVARSMSCPDLMTLTRKRRGDRLFKEWESLNINFNGDDVDLADTPPGTFKTTSGGVQTGSASFQPFSAKAEGLSANGAHTAPPQPMRASSPAAAAAGAGSGIFAATQSPMGLWSGVPTMDDGPIDFVVVRRQSFPSLENAEWRDSQIQVGLI